ncbi:MAG: DUF4391 domain-containing protein [Deltaproteobacteria bacterium]|jgi:hypothetical protein|nr:DUF4391 domain-containing protein [Deltaproteobacteria bacterium]
MLELFYERLGIPANCQLGKRVFKKLFYENTAMGATDKKAFSQDIEEIIWSYTLKPETINISRYEDEEREYHEVAVIQVTLANPTRRKRLAEIMQRAIPYPVLLVFVHDDKVAINVAQKRINRADSDKITATDFQDSNWLNPASPLPHEQAFLESCAVTSLPFRDFYAFYSALVDRVIALNCAELNGGTFSLNNGRERGDRIAQLARFQALQQELAGLKNELAKESQFNRKVSLNMKIKELAKVIVCQTKKL